MTANELQALLIRAKDAAAAKAALHSYVASFFPVILAAHKKHQEAVDHDFPERWPDTVHSGDHIANLFDLFESFELTDTALSIRTWECFRSEYDHKVEFFPRAIFDETDDTKRAALIDAHFAEPAARKRAEFQRDRDQEERNRQPSVVN